MNHSDDDEIGAGGGTTGAGVRRASSCHNKNFKRDEFCFQAKVVVEADEEGHGACSPTLWKKKNNDYYNNSCEFSPLLPCDHHFSDLSRLQVILEARKELMEMIRDLPESSYELSLKDIVDEHQKKIENNEDEDEDEERSFHFATETQQLKKIKEEVKKKKNIKRVESSGGKRFSRSASVDSEIFFIKMFYVPSCFGNSNNNKKKNMVTHKNGSSKVSPRNSFEITEDDHHHHHHQKVPRIRRIFSAGENNKVSGKIFSRSSRSNSDGISTTRHVFFFFFFF